jgi:hypothetical protein
VLERLSGEAGGAGVFAVASRSRLGTRWAVVWGAPFAECDCPGFVHRKCCWHVRTVAAEVRLEHIRKELACD